jgi:hypothetical protein
MRSRVQISARIQATMTEIFMICLIPSSKMLEYCLKLGHGLFAVYIPLITLVIFAVISCSPVRCTNVSELHAASIFRRMLDVTVRKITT